MKLKDVDGANESLTQVAFTTNLETYLQLRQTWLAFLILLGISIVVILLTLIFLRNRIRIAISLIGQGSK
jgi:choline transporter-like protein 2/4/5